MKIVLIDNNDSFTGNLEHILHACTRYRPVVVPYSHLNGVDPLLYDLAVISAGPGKPSEYPDYAPLLESVVPILGICLGLQIINEHFGGKTAKLSHCIHGKADTIQFHGKDFVVARYHSLYLDPVADCLEVIARNGLGLPMAVRHRTRAIIGYQFHPESFMTPEGESLIKYALRFLFRVWLREVFSASCDTRKGLRF